MKTIIIGGSQTELCCNSIGLWTDARDHLGRLSDIKLDEDEMDDDG
jgi:hypothetical protein